MIYEFKTNLKVAGEVPPIASIADLEKEIGVYSATPEFVSKYCGKISNSILDKIPATYFEEAKALGLYPNIDVRIHRLYPGDYPAYPGWHCDGEYRETYFSQPDLNRIKVHKHLICTVSSHENGVSNCEFLNMDFRIDSRSSADFPLWGEVDRELSSFGHLPTIQTQDGTIYLFDGWSLHRVMPAKIRGWRLFFRMAMWHKPNLGEGKITKQEQVYQISGNQGW